MSEIVSSSGASVLGKVIAGLAALYFWYVAQYVFLTSVREQFPIPVLIMLAGIGIGAAGYQKDKSIQAVLIAGIIAICLGMFILWSEIASFEVTIPGFVIIVIGTIIFLCY